jgi:hypothetical protein
MSKGRRALAKLGDDAPSLESVIRFAELVRCRELDYDKFVALFGRWRRSVRVAQLKPTVGSAELAAVNLRRQGFEVFYPTFAERKLRCDRVQTVATPVFSGYMFVEIINGLCWALINSTYGVNKLSVRKAPDGFYNNPTRSPTISSINYRSARIRTTRPTGFCQ